MYFLVQGRAQPGLHKHRGIVARTGWTRCPEVGLTEGFQVVTKTAKVVPTTKVHICSVNPDVWGQTNRYEFHDRRQTVQSTHANPMTGVENVRMTLQNRRR